MPSSTQLSTLSLHDALPICERFLLRRGRAGLFVPDRRHVPHRLRDLGFAPWTALAVLYGATLGTGALAVVALRWPAVGPPAVLDRKSTRLNSSHEWISYAVFHPALHSFPTRRSSDLRALPAAARPGGAVRARSPPRAAPAPRLGLRAVDRARGAVRRHARHWRARRRRAALAGGGTAGGARSEEHTSELQSRVDLVCRLPPSSPLFPYTTLFRSASASCCGAAGRGCSCPIAATCRTGSATWASRRGPRSRCCTAPRSALARSPSSRCVGRRWDRRRC